MDVTAISVLHRNLTRKHKIGCGQLTSTLRGDVNRNLVRPKHGLPPRQLLTSDLNIAVNAVDHTCNRLRQMKLIITHMKSNACMHRHKVRQLHSSNFHGIDRRPRPFFSVDHGRPVPKHRSTLLNRDLRALTGGTRALRVVDNCATSHKLPHRQTTNTR